MQQKLVRRDPAAMQSRQNPRRVDVYMECFAGASNPHFLRLIEPTIEFDSIEYVVLIKRMHGDEVVQQHTRREVLQLWFVRRFQQIKGIWSSDGDLRGDAAFAEFQCVHASLTACGKLLQQRNVEGRLLVIQPQCGATFPFPAPRFESGEQTDKFGRLLGRSLHTQAHRPNFIRCFALAAPQSSESLCVDELEVRIAVFWQVDLAGSQRIERYDPWPVRSWNELRIKRRYAEQEGWAGERVEQRLQRLRQIKFASVQPQAERHLAGLKCRPAASPLAV